MLIHRILTMSRRNKPRSRPRRSAAEPRFQLESLEDRTALSVAWDAPQFAPLVTSAAEVRLEAIRTDASVIRESAVLETGPAAVPVPASSAAFDPANSSSLPTTESTAIGRGVIASLVSNAVTMAGDGTTIGPIEAADATFVPKSSALDSLGTITGPRSIIAATDFINGTTTFDGGGIGHFLDLRFQDPALPMSPPFEMGDPIGFPPSRGPFPANTGNNETDESLSGPVPWTETDTGILTGMSLSQASGRSTGRGSSPVFADLGLLMNPTGEVGSSSGLLYLATGASAGLLDELAVSREDEVLMVDQGVTKSDTTASILDAGIPLSILLWGTDVPVPTDQGGVEQVAELIPVSESSLALAATLWTVRSESQASAPGSDLTAGGAADPAIVSPAPTYWAVFMTGVDRAFEQTFRDVQLDTLGGDGRHKKGKETRRGPDDRLEWRGPILPGAAEGLPGGKQRSTRPSRSAAVDESNNGEAKTPGRPAISHLTGGERGKATSQTVEVAQPQDSEAQPVVLASTPVLWVVSISSIVAGWFWGKKRERRQRSWREGKGEC